MSVVLSPEQLLVLQDLAEGGDGGGLYPDTSYRYANAYNYLRQLLGGDSPSAGADPAVWNWLKGAELVNRGIGPLSDFIRSYTASQFSIRYGVLLSDDALNLASNAIADAVIGDIVQNQGEIPDLRRIGTDDAAETVRELASHIPGLEQSDVATWSGNPLFVLLGDSSFLVENIIDSPEGTYDFLAMMEAIRDALPGFLNPTSVTDIVRRQNIWHNSRRRSAECGPRLGLMFRRRACGVASADVRVSFA